MGIGKPIYNYPIRANFLGLSAESAATINKFYMTQLRFNLFKGTNIEVDVLNNRRHQIIAVFLPCLAVTTVLFQMTMYQFTKAPSITKQTPMWRCGAKSRTSGEWHGITPWETCLMWPREHITGHSTRMKAMRDTEITRRRNTNCLVACQCAYHIWTCL